MSCCRTRVPSHTTHQSLDCPLCIVLQSISPAIRAMQQSQSMRVQTCGIMRHVAMCLLTCRTMFDETGEKLLRSTDLLERLREGLDGPDAWIKWDLARAIARNIVFKLEDPPRRAIATKFWDRFHAGLRSFARHFPNLPPEWVAGDRIDDPTVPLLFHKQAVVCLRCSMPGRVPVHHARGTCLHSCIMHPMATLHSSPLQLHRALRDVMLAARDRLARMPSESKPASER